MITDLCVRGLGTVTLAEVQFKPGLNVITGETGAGKTMLLRALTLVIGGKADQSWIAHSSNEAVVDAVFSVSDDVYQRAVEVAEDACPPDASEATVALGRVVGARSRASVNGRLVPAATQTDVAEHLMSIHGQHEQRSLIRAGKQREVLDRFGGSEHLEQLQTLAEVFGSLRRLKQRIAELQALHASALVNSAAANEMCSTFDRLAPADDELRSLDESIALVTESETVRSTIAAVLTAVEGHENGGGVRSALHVAARELLKLGERHPSLSAVSQRLVAAAAEVDDIATEVRAAFDSVDSNPAEIERLHSRRADLMRLLRLTGQVDIPALRAFIAEQRRTANPETLEADIAQFVEESKHLQRMCDGLVSQISRSRAVAAEALAIAVTERLQRLGLHGARFVVTLPACEPNAMGAEQVSFMLVTGDVAVPLGNGVSGGEMSRVALAVECALAGADPVPVMVFDEVDAGIGGQTAHEVAAALSELARTTQVIVVTHLPQVAAYADHHIRVTRDNTGTTVEALSDEEREIEVARMLGEIEGIAIARDLAAQLLAARRKSH